MVLLRKKKKVASIFLASMFCINMAKIGMLDASAYDSVNRDKVVQRISGKDRYETSMKLSNELKSEKAYLVSGKNFADVLSIGPIAAKEGASVVLVNDNDYSFIQNMKNNNVKNVVIVGGENSVSKDIENKVRENFKVVRVGGKDRYDTSRQILELYGKHQVGVATGKTFPDALSAGVFLASEDMPLLLVKGLNSDELGSSFVGKYTFGGEKSVPFTYGERISGVDRYETSLKIAKKRNLKDTVFICSGKDFADSLSATSLAKHYNAPILLVGEKPLFEEAKELINNAKKVVIIGGEKSVPLELESNIKNGFKVKSSVESEKPIVLKYRSSGSKSRNHISIEVLDNKKEKDTPKSETDKKVNPSGGETSKPETDKKVNPSGGETSKPETDKKVNPSGGETSKSETDKKVNLNDGETSKPETDKKVNPNDGETSSNSSDLDKDSVSEKDDNEISITVSNGDDSKEFISHNGENLLDAILKDDNSEEKLTLRKYFNRYKVKKVKLNEESTERNVSELENRKIEKENDADGIFLEYIASNSDENTSNDGEVQNEPITHDFVMPNRTIPVSDVGNITDEESNKVIQLVKDFNTRNVSSVEYNKESKNIVVKYDDGAKDTTKAISDLVHLMYSKSVNIGQASNEEKVVVENPKSIDIMTEMPKIKNLILSKISSEEDKNKVSDIVSTTEKGKKVIRVRFTDDSTKDLEVGDYSKKKAEKVSPKASDWTYKDVHDNVNSLGNGYTSISIDKNIFKNIDWIEAFKKSHPKLEFSQDEKDEKNKKYEPFEYTTIPVNQGDLIIHLPYKFKKGDSLKDKFSIKISSEDMGTYILKIKSGKIISVDSEENKVEKQFREIVYPKDLNEYAISNNSYKKIISIKLRDSKYNSFAYKIMDQGTKFYIEKDNKNYDYTREEDKNSIGRKDNKFNISLDSGEIKINFSKYPIKDGEGAEVSEDDKACIVVDNNKKIVITFPEFGKDNHEIQVKNIEILDYKK